jgi:glycolate oxidase FAD binding subunit
VALFRPSSPAEVLDVVRWAAGEEKPLEVLGHGTRRSVGRPMQADTTLDLSTLAGVTLYEPDELVLSALAGTPLAEVKALVRDANQMLAFEPVDFGPIAGTARGRGTVGGAVASNLSGPRRIKAGAARDHVLGVKAVSGRGEAFKSGGRVVKNVTGYDLSKGLSGSWGTLAVMTELTLKVLPRPETAVTLVVAGLEDARAVAALCDAMGSPYDVSAAAHLPEAVASELPDAAFAAGGRAATLVRLEGFADSVADRAERLTGRLAPFGPVATLGAQASEALWRSLRDAEPFGGRLYPLWRVSVAPTAGPAIVKMLGRRFAIRHFYDWSGGLVWIEVADEGAPDGLAGEIRAAIAAVGDGHATLMRGSPALRAATPPFEPQPEALAALSRRLKEQFDPRGILNPGRMSPH